MRRRDESYYWSLEACLTKIETFFPVGSLRRMVCMTSLLSNHNARHEGNELPIGLKNDDQPLPIPLLKEFKAAAAPLSRGPLSDNDRYFL